VWNQLNEGIAAAARSVPAARKGTRVYFEVGAGPYAASEISHVGELLARLGMVNVVPGSLGSVPKLNPEFVVRADPEAIVISARDAAQMRQRPGWSRIRAVREGHVCALDATDAAVVMRPGPRLAEAARILARCLSQ
jgi:iron complex transport system substrate-binding protein